MPATTNGAACDVATVGEVMATAIGRPAEMFAAVNT